MCGVECRTHASGVRFLCQIDPRLSRLFVGFASLRAFVTFYILWGACSILPPLGARHTDRCVQSSALFEGVRSVRTSWADCNRSRPSSRTACCVARAGAMGRVAHGWSLALMVRRDVCDAAPCRPTPRLTAHRTASAGTISSKKHRATEASGRSAVGGWTISRTSAGLAGAGGNSGGVKGVLRRGAMR